MKQIALALHNYESATTSFPLGGNQAPQNMPGTCCINWGAWSAHSMLLPYLEQTPIYNSLNFMAGNRGSSLPSNAYTERINSTGTWKRINSFLCPSSSPPIGSNDGNFNPGIVMPGNSYYASTGSSLMWLGNGSSFPNGPFAVNGPARSNRDIQDGTSNTIAFGEWRIGDQDGSKMSIQDIVSSQNYGLFGATGRDMIAPGSNMPLGGGALLTALQQCSASWQAHTPSNYSQGANNQNDGSGQRSWNGRLWHVGLYGHALGNTLVPPNSPYPYCQFWSTNSDFDSGGIIGLSSFHPGGANVAMADGSVHFIKSSIAWNILWGLGSMAQGEVISADAY
jgi:prepilin-type processing-associated H-X9-DG protein